MADFVLAGNREIPSLLFVTSSTVLDLIDVSEATLQAQLGGDHHVVVLENLPAQPWTNHADALAATGPVRVALGAHPEVGGVVLIGGYDTVPSRVIKAIDPALAAKVDSKDADRFFAWNDDLYGDTNGDGLAELPVSRIPFSEESADSLWRALEANREDAGDGANGVRATRRGVRTSPFKFARGIYDTLVPGDDEMLVWTTGISSTLGDSDLEADRIYIALHGHRNNGSRFFDTGSLEWAVAADDLPDADGSVVFACCCWGALTVHDAPFLASKEPRRPPPRTRENSIAVAFVAKGARAFIGFTALHWVPAEWPYWHFGAPLHELFWRRYSANNAPAKALYKAKRDYILNTPHLDGTSQAGSDFAVAAEMKAFWSATCLGLGW